MSTGLKANSDGSAAIQVGGTDVITLTSGGAATFVTSPTTVQAGTAAAPSITFSGDTNTGIYSPGADQVAIATGGTKRFEVDAAGNAGLGVTPSAWSGAVPRALQVGSGSYLASNSDGTLQLGSNGYYNGSNFLYTSTAFAGRYAISTSTGAHSWFTAPSGTAGNAITFTQVMAVEGGKSLALEGAVSQAGTGITFPATQSASSNANTLDDYEEGDWTPSVGGTATYQAGNYGKYTKIGNVVTCQFQIRINTIGTGSSVRLSGFPFAAANISDIQSGCVSYWDTLAVNTIFLSFYIENNATTAQFVGKATSGANVDNGIGLFGNSAKVYGSITYRVA